MSVKYTRASRRARWNQRIRDARDPVERLKLAGDFARAAAKGVPPHVAARALDGPVEALRKAAAGLDIAMEKEAARGNGK